MRTVENNVKFVLTEETNVVEQPNGVEVVVHRIKCVNSFTDRFGHKIDKGTLGGFVENCDNLSQTDNAWIADNAVVFGHVKVCNSGYVSCNAFVFADTYVYCIIKGHICGDAHCFNTDVYDSSSIQDYSWVWNSVIYDRVCIGGNAKIEDCEWNSAHLDKYLYVGLDKYNDKYNEYDISLYKVGYTNTTHNTQYITEGEFYNEKCTFSVETVNS